MKNLKYKIYRAFEEYLPHKEFTTLMSAADRVLMPSTVLCRDCAWTVWSFVDDGVHSFVNLNVMHGKSGQSSWGA